MTTMDAANYSLEEMDRQSFLHPSTSIADHLKNGPTIIAGGSGVRLKDRQGRDLIDCGAGLWCVNIGYGRPELAEAAAQAMRDLGYYHTFASHSSEPIIRLADRVLTLFRDRAGAGHLSKIFFGTSGSDANDTNFKLVRYYNNLRGRPLKKKIISRLGSYHGLTYAAGSLTGIPAFHRPSTCQSRESSTPPARISTALPNVARTRRPSRPEWFATSRC
jgi:L-2,4-diaminobutyrate transaminase